MSETPPAVTGSSPSADPSGAAPLPSAAGASGRPNVKAWLYGYLAVYAVLFILYFYVLATRTEKITPEEWMSRADVPGRFAGRGEGGRLFDPAPDLNVLSALSDLYDRLRVEPRAPDEPTAGEVRFLKPYAFILPTGQLKTLREGERLTRADAAALAWAITAAQTSVEADAAVVRRAPGEMTIHRESFLYGLDWPYWLTLVNLAGFFLLIWLFLWGPMRNFLGGVGEKTALALAKAREAQAEAETLKGKYAALVEELEAKRAANDAAAAEDIRAESDRILTAAKAESELMITHLQMSMEAELRQARERIKREVAAAAMDEARKVLVETLTAADHHAAVSAFMDDVDRVRL